MRLLFRMNLLPYLKLRGRLFAGFIPCAILASVMGLVGIYSLSRIQEKMRSTAGGITAWIGEHNNQQYHVSNLQKIASNIINAKDRKILETAKDQLNDLPGGIGTDSAAQSPVVMSFMRLIFGKEKQLEAGKESERLRNHCDQLLSEMIRLADQRATTTEKGAVSTIHDALMQLTAAASQSYETLSDHIRVLSEKAVKTTSAREEARVARIYLYELGPAIKETFSSSESPAARHAQNLLHALISNRTGEIAVIFETRDLVKPAKIAQTVPNMAKKAIHGAAMMVTDISSAIHSMDVKTWKNAEEVERESAMVMNEMMDGVKNHVHALSLRQMEAMKHVSESTDKEITSIHAAHGLRGSCDHLRLLLRSSFMADTPEAMDKIQTEMDTQFAEIRIILSGLGEDQLTKSISDKTSEIETATHATMDARIQIWAAKQDLDQTLLEVNRQIENFEESMIAEAKVVQSHAETMVQSVGHFIDHCQYLLWALTLIILLLAIALAYRTDQSMIKPIRDIVAFLRGMGEGRADLTKRLDDSRKDELGDMASWFNTFVARVQAVVQGMIQCTSTLAGAAVQLSGTATHLSQGAECTTQQSATLSNTSGEMAVNMNRMSASTEKMTATIRAVTASVEEMTAGVEEISIQAKQASDVANHAAQLAESSNHTIGQLGNAAEEIDKVIETIQDIAEQINLLALNATIEAARAGETGKGFAVVATEVKELAHQTAHATEDIRGRIERLQSTTNDAIGSIGQVGNVIQKINDVSTVIAKAFGEQNIAVRQIARNISETSDAADEVTSSVNESAMATQKITQNIAGFDAAARETSADAGLAQTAACELSRIADQLQALVRPFDV